MDGIFERLELLLRSEWNFRHRDPLENLDREAWEAYQELERELRHSPGANAESRARGREPEPDLPPKVLEAYRELELPPGAPFEAVRKAYRYQILRHHPDRFADDPTRYAQATAKTQRLNQAFQTLERQWNR